MTARGRRDERLDRVALTDHVGEIGSRTRAVVRRRGAGTGSWSRSSTSAPCHARDLGEVDRAQHLDAVDERCLGAVGVRHDDATDDRRAPRP